MEEHGPEGSTQGDLDSLEGLNDDTRNRETDTETINGKEGGMRPD